MTHYLVTRCLRQTAPHRSYPYSVGDVELRSAASDMSSERKAIERSLGEHGEPTVQPDVSALRASTIVEATGPRTAFALAALRIDEALDVLASTNPVQAFTYRLMEAGCARDLNTGEVMPRLPEVDPGQFNPLGSIFLMEQYTYQPRDIAQHVLSTERGELGARYGRAAHWARKADFESNPHMAMLFEWFAAESIWNVQRDDDVIPAIRWSLGFPNGPRAQLLAPTTRQAIDGDALHRPWSIHIDNRLQRIRSIRNQTVHNGFRLLDVPPAEVSGLRTLAHLAARYALHSVQHGIYAKIDSIADLIEYLPLLLDTNLHATSKHVVERIQEAAGATT